MELDFDENPALKFVIIGIVIVIIVAGLFVYKEHFKAKKVTKKAASTNNQVAYLFTQLPPTMTLQQNQKTNPYILGNNQIRIPTDANLIYISGVHYVYSIGPSNKPVVFTSFTLTAHYTGPSITSPIGVQYTEVGSNTSIGMFSNFYNLYYINGEYVGTIAINGNPSIVTLSALPTNVASNFFNYGMATARILNINNTQVLLVANITTINGTKVDIGWFFLPDRIVYEKDFTVNGTTYEWTYYMQMNVSPNQYMTLPIGGGSTKG